MVRKMSEIPLKPITKEDVRKLELALVLGTLFRAEVLQQIRDAEDKVTWLDSLVIAAAALARDRAGIPISVIAEELGRSETTIRNHLAGKTEAGRLVKETYEMLVKKGGRIEELLAIPIGVNIDELRKRIDELEREVRELRSKLEFVRTKLSEIITQL